MSLKYNNGLADFEGETPKAVITAIFFDSAMGNGQGFDAWWEHQSRLLQNLHDITLPHHTEPGAAEQLLHSLVKAGVLDIGARAPHVRDAKPGQGSGPA